MEFGEKLCELRKNKGLTQEQLSEALYVSRTAISKWESGRGYPNIDSLKEISKFFSVSIDDLLSGEKIISIAEKENNTNIRNMCDLLFGICDILYIALIFLPLYSYQTGEHIYAVNLFDYLEKVSFNHIIYPIIFLLLTAGGIIKLLLLHLKAAKGQKELTLISMLLGAITVLLLAVAREAYAISAAFILLLIKGILLFKYLKTDS